MQKVLTAEQMREVDRLTTERYGIPSILLMENAAHAVARVIKEKLGGSVKGKSILILCGPGNNGGDGAALARILWTLGAGVTVALIGSSVDAKGDARANFEILKKLNERETLLIDLPTFEVWEYEDIYTVECADVDSWQALLHESWFGDEPDVLVDALFGTGLTRRVQGIYEEVIYYIRSFNIEGIPAATKVVSVDLPSGMNSDLPESVANCRAHFTITFTSPKIANVIPPAACANGELIVAQIGSPRELVEEQRSQTFVTEESDVVKWLTASEFTSSSYKNKRGHALIVAGSENYSGAAVLAGNASMRSGAGLVTIVTPKSSKESIAGRVLPEVMVRGAAETENGAIAVEAFDEIHELLSKANVVAIGSGLSQSESTRRFVEKIVHNLATPVVLDADAINLLSPFSDHWQNPRVSNGDRAAKNDLPSPTPGLLQNPLILTPHEGEFMRLLGTTDKEAIRDRVAAVREFSQKHGVLLVLKGERVLIGEPGGKVVVNPTGNSGLGKAGNGDTLTGVLAGFVAQAAAMKIDIFETVVAAVYVAGLAGDAAETKFGRRVMTASDVRECLKDAFASLQEED